jgi:anti-anti-sigma regulatory factor
VEIAVSQQQARVLITVLQPYDRIDGSNYTELIARAQDEYESGARNFLLDLAQVSYMSSAGLVALHKIAMITVYGILPEEESGWEAFRAIERDAKAGFQPHLKLLSPQPRVEKVLSMSGMDQFLQVFTDAQAALEAF